VSLPLATSLLSLSHGCSTHAHTRLVSHRVSAQLTRTPRRYQAKRGFLGAADRHQAHSKPMSKILDRLLGFGEFEVRAHSLSPLPLVHSKLQRRRRSREACKRTKGGIG
jgi:hypothetical protein